MTENAVDIIEREVEILKRRYRTELAQAIDLLNSYDEPRQPSTHLGHNLAARACTLSEVAAKYEQTVALLNHVKSEAPS